MLALEHNTFGEIGLIVSFTAMLVVFIVTLSRRDRSALDHARHLPLESDDGDLQPTPVSSSAGEAKPEA